MTRGRILLIACSVTIAIAAVAWTQRASLLAHWHANQLAVADEGASEACAQALAQCGASALGPIWTGLTAEDEKACRNLEAGLRALAKDWPLDDPRTLQAVEGALAAFDRLSVAGKRAALHFGSAVAGRDDAGLLPGPLARALGELMAAGERLDDMRPDALALAGALLERSPTGQWHAACRALARKGLADSRVATRVAALQLILRDPLRKDAELAALALPSLGDGDAGVRRASVLLLGTNADVVSEERLLPLLHDGDADVRRLCEMALRGRGLSDTHIQLARLISDSDPAVRLRVLPLLRQATDLDLDVWLRRLSVDPAPAVRAAAVRAAAIEPSDDLRQRLGEMAQTDPSPTVREIARFYLDRNSLRKVGN